MTQSATLEKPVAVYSTVSEEYIAATQGAGIADRSHLARLKVSGADGIDLLNRLSTNKIDDLEVGDVQGTVLTTNKGRIMDLLYVLRQEDHLLVITSPDTREKVSEWIDFYTFIEDVVIEDVSEATAMLTVVGPNASDALTSLADVPPYGSATLKIGEVDALAFRTDFAGVESYDIVASAQDSNALWETLTDLNAVPAGTEALELVRIEQGIAGYDGELCEDYNPLEAGLKDFISFNKGCYIGQEVVARLNTYDKVQKHLVRLSWNGEAVPELPVALTHEGRQVGTLTSATKSLNGDGYTGLGYVRKAHVQEGTQLLSEGGLEVVVEVIPQHE